MNSSKLQMWSTSPFSSTSMFQQAPVPPVTARR